RGTRRYDESSTRASSTQITEHPTSLTGGASGCLGAFPRCRPGSPGRPSSPSTRQSASRAEHPFMEATVMAERILIIEDDSRIADMLRRGLIYEGYEAEVALDGESGLRSARDHPPDIVILDWMLPGLDGLEVL